MSARLPEDYAIDALAVEADKLRQAGKHQYSYGKLVADTTEEQRQQIAERYRRKKHGEPETDRFRQETDEQAVRSIKKRKKAEEEEQEA